MERSKDVALYDVKYDFSHVKDLRTPEEKQDPYADFYEVPVKPPARYLLDAIRPGGTLDPAEAMLPGGLGALFAPGYLPGENGYALLPNGVGCIAINTRLPGATPEMEAFWNGWFRSKDLYYKIWLPGLHFGHQQTITEDLGWGPIELKPYSFVDIAKIFAPGDPKRLDPEFSSVMGGSMYFDLDGKRCWCSLVHYYRANPEGMEIRTRSWLGVRMEVDGSWEVRVEPDAPIPLEWVRLLAAHHAWEFTRKADIMADVFHRARQLAEKAPKEDL